jgi:uncharacterized protein YsxB (DUF464 family)
VIFIDIKLKKNEILKSLKASGHAFNSKKGNDIVCAAATCLLRTAANLISNEKDIKSKGSAEKPGKMEILLDKYPESKTDWLTGVTGFLKKGLLDLEREFPDNIKVNISNID